MQFSDFRNQSFTLNNRGEGGDTTDSSCHSSVSVFSQQNSHRPYKKKPPQKKRTLKDDTGNLYEQDKNRLMPEQHGDGFTAYGETGTHDDGSHPIS